MEYPSYEDGVAQAKRIMSERYPKRFEETDGKRGYVYMIKKETEAGDVHRIGWTREPAKRMGEHNETGWLPAVILAVGEFADAQAVETQIMRDLDAEGRRIRPQKSWFDLDLAWEEKLTEHIEKGDVT